MSKPTRASAAADGREQTGAVGRDHRAPQASVGHRFPLERPLVGGDPARGAAPSRRPRTPPGRRRAWRRGTRRRGRHRCARRTRRVVPAWARRGRAVAQPRVGLHEELPHERGLARAPRRRAGRAGVAEREGVEQQVVVGVADGLREPSDGALVGEVTAGGGVGEQEVVAHRPGQELRPAGIETDARRHRARGRDPDHRVVAGATLADVVQQRREQEHVGTGARRATSPSKPAPRGSSGSSSAAHSATASSECRSTVNRWYALRCGRARTCSHSGRRRTSTPTWSSVSNTAIAPGPDASSATKASSASGSSSTSRTCSMRASVARSNGTRSSAARAAAHRTIAASTDASGSNAIRPSRRRMPSTEVARRVPERARPVLRGARTATRGPT